MVRVASTLIIAIILSSCASHPRVGSQRMAEGDVEYGYAFSVENVLPYLWYRKGISKRSDIGVRVGLPIYGSGLDYSRLLYEKDNKDSSFYKGMSAVFKECDGFLKKNSIEKIKCSVDDEFDPTFHEALEVSKSDQIDKDKIINIIQDGYLIKDKLFRPTLVTVSSGKGDSDE